MRDKPLSPAVDLVKVTFDLEESDWHDQELETVWARKKSDNIFVLKNIPFYAYGYSLGDEVIVKKQDGRLYVQSCNRRSGHSTYRIFFVTDDEESFGASLSFLDEMGCGYERAIGRLFSVDVPPEVDINAVYSELERGEVSGIWGFEEAHYGHG